MGNTPTKNKHLLLYIRGEKKGEKSILTKSRPEILLRPTSFLQGVYRSSGIPGNWYEVPTYTRHTAVYTRDIFRNGLALMPSAAGAVVVRYTANDRSPETLHVGVSQVPFVRGAWNAYLYSYFLLDVQQYSV